MKRFFLYNESKGGRHFWMPLTAGGYIGRILLFLILLALFILLFCLQDNNFGCSGHSGEEIKEVVTDDGQTIIGLHPELMDPVNSRGDYGVGDDGYPYDRMVRRRSRRIDAGATDPRSGQRGGDDSVPGGDLGNAGATDPRNGQRGGDDSVPGGDLGNAGAADSRNGQRTGHGSIPGNGRNGNPVQWPITVDEGSRNPALPSPERNIMPVPNTDDQITDSNTGRQIDGSHLYVVLNSDNGDQTYNRFAEELTALYPTEDCSIEYYNTLSKTIILCVNPTRRMEIKESLPVQITDIHFFVVEVELLDITYQPNDKAFNYSDYSWHFDAIQAKEAWDITKGSNGVTVAVIDSYFDLSHPDLKNVRIVHPYSIERGTDNVSPPAPDQTTQVAFLHGTHVAGIIFGEMDNVEGSCGIAPECSFMPISIGSNPTNYLQIESILYAIYKGATVINLSMGLGIDERIARRLTLRDQVAIAQNEFKQEEALWNYIFELCDQRNVTIVWAGGNEDLLTQMDESKRNQQTIRVTAVNQRLKKASFSNFGNLAQFNLDGSTISAPGVSILSTVPGGDYASLDGTSMAAPIVTAAVALMKSLNANLTNEEIIEILKATAKPVADESIGDLLQIADALKAVRGEFMRSDEIEEDHSNLIGCWESTIKLYTLHDHDPNIIRMTFTNEHSGTIQYFFLYGNHEGEVCSAPFVVTFTDSGIHVDLQSNPTSPGGFVFSESRFVLDSDDEGFMQATCYQDSEEVPVYHFRLRKI